MSPASGRGADDRISPALLTRASTDKILRQSPEVIHVIMRKHVPEQIADPLAWRNISVDGLAARKNLPQRTILHQIARHLAQRLAGIKNISVRIHSGKHRGIALKISEAQQRLDGSRRAIDGLYAVAPPRNDGIYQRVITRVLQ